MTPLASSFLRAIALTPAERRTLHADGTLRFRPTEPRPRWLVKEPRPVPYGGLRAIARRYLAGEFGPGARVNDVAQAHGVNAGSLYCSVTNLRRDMRLGRVDGKPGRPAKRRAAA